VSTVPCLCDREHLIVALDLSVAQAGFHISLRITKQVLWLE